MRRRIRVLLADRRFQVIGDCALAAAILAGSLVEIAAGGESWSGRGWIEVVIAVLCSVPLVWRRAQPAAVLLVVLPASIASAMLVAPIQGPFETFVAVVIAIYSVGVHLPSRRGAVLLAAAAALLIGGWLATRQWIADSYLGNWFPIVVWLTAAWGIGRIIRTYTLRAGELEQLARELAGERDARAREAVAVERARLARELHDVVAHNVSVMSVQAAAARRVLEGDQPAVRRALQAIETTGRETIDEMRHMLGVLREPSDELTLAPQPGLRDLDALAAQMRAAGLPVAIQVEGEPRMLPAGLELSAYRIVQEGLTNTLKHAGASGARVAVRYLERAVELEVVDDGTSAGGAFGTGNGLVGMRERVALFGGELAAGRREEGGWSLRARLPVAAA